MLNFIVAYGRKATWIILLELKEFKLFFLNSLLEKSFRKMKDLEMSNNVKLKKRINERHQSPVFGKRKLNVPETWSGRICNKCSVINTGVCSKSRSGLVLEKELLTNHI